MLPDAIAAYTTRVGAVWKDGKEESGFSEATNNKIAENKKKAEAERKKQEEETK